MHDMDHSLNKLKDFLDKNIQHLQKCQAEIPGTQYLLEAFMGLKGSSCGSGVFSLDQELMSYLSKIRIECYFGVIPGSMF